MSDSSAPLPLPARRQDAHKGDFGRVLVIGGSRGMSGAPALAGMAALRSGAGLVRLAVPACCLETVASYQPSYMTLPLPCDEQGRITLAAADTLASELAAADVVACGPGLGRSDGLTEFVRRMFIAIPVPLVLDADALNALSSLDEFPTPSGPRVLTPHPGEFQRLSDVAPGEEQQAAAVEFARRQNVVLILKGHRSLITDGRHTHHNETGNPGMASGGSGDVLTGVVAALLALPELTPLDAARLGAHLHGLAGDLAAAELGQVSLIASDIVDYLPQAFVTVSG